MDRFIPQEILKFSPKWKQILAKLLGKRLVGRDGYMVTVAYMWRGVLYIEDIVDTAPRSDYYGPSLADMIKETQPKTPTNGTKTKRT